MAEIEEESIFVVDHDQITFSTRTNGDRITISHANIGQDAAAALAWLINNGSKLEIQIKKVVI